MVIGYNLCYGVLVGDVQIPPKIRRVLRTEVQNNPADVSRTRNELTNRHWNRLDT